MSLHAITQNWIKKNVDPVELKQKIEKARIEGLGQSEDGLYQWCFLQEVMCDNVQQLSFYEYVKSLNILEQRESLYDFEAMNALERDGKLREINQKYTYFVSKAECIISAQLTSLLDVPGYFYFDWADSNDDQSKGVYGIAYAEPVNIMRIVKS